MSITTLTSKDEKKQWWKFAKQTWRKSATDFYYTTLSNKWLNISVCTSEKGFKWTNFEQIYLKWLYTLVASRPNLLSQTCITSSCDCELESCIDCRTVADVCSELTVPTDKKYHGGKSGQRQPSSANHGHRCRISC